MKKYYLFILMLVSVGCATSNSSKIGFEDAPRPVLDDNKAIVYFMRQKVNPSMRSPVILINDQKMGSLPNNSFFWVNIEPGNKLISAEWSWDTGAGNETFQIDIEAGKTYYLILKQTGQQITFPAYFSSFSSNFFVIEDEVAMQYLNKLKYYRQEDVK